MKKEKPAVEVLDKWLWAAVLLDRVARKMIEGSKVHYNSSATSNNRRLNATLTHAEVTNAR